MQGYARYLMFKMTRKMSMCKNIQNGADLLLQIKDNLFWQYPQRINL